MSRKWLVAVAISLFVLGGAAVGCGGDDEGDGDGTEAATQTEGTIELTEATDITEGNFGADDPGDAGDAGAGGSALQQAYESCKATAKKIPAESRQRALQACEAMLAQ